MNHSFNDPAMNKIRSTSGETIAETLIALLISALALVMLAASISVASHMVTTSREKLRDYYDANEVIVKQDTVPGGLNGIAETEANKTISIKEVGAASVSTEITSVKVDIFTNKAFSNKPVKSYKFKKENE